MKEWAKEVDQSVKSIHADVMAEMKEPYLKSLKGEAKIKQAWNAVRARLAKTMQIPTQSFLIHIMDKADRKVIKIKNGTEKMEIANFWGLAQAVDNDDLGSQIYFMRGVGMREGAKVIDKFEINKSYEVDLALDNHEGDILNLSTVDKKSSPKVADGLSKKKARKIVREMFEQIDIADAAFKLSEDKSDLRIVEGNVVSARTPTSKKGNVFGRYTLIDDSMDLKTIKDNGGLRVMCDATQVTVADGSDIMVIGVIDEYEGRVSMTAEAIIPIVPIPRIVESIEDDDEVPDIDEDMEDEDIDIDEESDDDEDSDEDSDEESDDDDSEDPDEDEDFDDDEDEEDEKPKSKKPKSKKKKPEPEEDEDDEFDEVEDGEDFEEDEDDDDNDSSDEDSDEDDDSFDDEDEDDPEPPKKPSKKKSGKKDKKDKKSDKKSKRKPKKKIEDDDEDED